MAGRASTWPWLCLRSSGKFLGMKMVNAIRSDCNVGYQPLFRSWAKSKKKKAGEKKNGFTSTSPWSNQPAKLPISGACTGRAAGWSELPPSRWTPGVIPRLPPPPRSRVKGLAPIGRSVARNRASLTKGRKGKKKKTNEQTSEDKDQSCFGAFRHPVRFDLCSTSKRHHPFRFDWWSVGYESVALFERSEFLIDTSQKKSLRVCTRAVCTCARVQ